jgi:hypothetical protein
MATNFPTSVDVLTNPVSNDSLNSPSHSAQHANANDAIEAIETYLLPNGAGNSGLIKIIPTSATNATIGANGDMTISSAVSSVTVTGAFSATYAGYKVVLVNSTLSIAGATFHWQLASGGVQSSVSYSYGIAAMDYAANAFRYERGQNTSQIVCGYSVTAGGTVSTTFDLLNPFAAKDTHFIGINYVGTSTGYGGMGAGIHQVGTSYDGFRISSSSGTITGGTIQIYGYK